ncbi:hypothetical protein TYRP_020020 [Tyrophagus putrescentiae]|nr:hypothetical protein TYRP_020020 [Tyrophagus putrescentiae]
MANGPSTSFKLKLTTFSSFSPSWSKLPASNQTNGEWSRRPEERGMDLSRLKKKTAWRREREEEDLIVNKKKGKKG